MLPLLNKELLLELIQPLLTKMNLVTREEFEVQSKVLERTRKKLTELEQIVEQYLSAQEEKVNIGTQEQEKLLEEEVI